MSDQYNPNGYAPYGYDPQTGKPNPAPNQQPQIVSYDPQTGQPIYADQGASQQQAPQVPQQIIGYDPQTGEPIYGQPQQAQQYAGYQQPAYQPAYDNPMYAQPYQQPEAPKKKKTGLIAGIVAAVVVVLAAFAIFVWPKPFSGSRTSKGTVATAVENSTKAVLSHNDIGAYFANYIGTESTKPQGFNLKINNLGSLITAFSGDPSYAGIGGSAEAGMIVSPKDKDGSMNLSFSILGMSYSADLYYSEQGLVISLPGLLTDTYMIPFENAEAELANSIFNPASGSMYALDSDSYNQLLQVVRQMNQLKNNLDQNGDLVSDIEAKLEAQGLKKEFTETKGSFTVDGETVKGTIATLDLSTQDLTNYVRFAEVYVRDYVTRLTSQMPDLYLDLDLDDFEDLVEEIQDNNIAAVITLNIYKNYVVSFDIEVYDTTNRMIESHHLTGDLGKDPSKSDHIVLNLTSNNSSITTTLDYQVTTSTDTQYASTATLSQNYQNVYECNFDWNKMTGDFTLTVLDSTSMNYIGGTEQGQYILTGTIMAEANKLTIAPGNLVISDNYSGSFQPRQSYSLSGIEVTLDSNATVSKITGTPKDLLTLSEADVTALVQELQSNLGMFSGMLGY